MRVAVVGLGGVGGYIAAYLAKSGVDVTGIARGAHKEAIQKSGIRIVEDDRTFQTPLHVVSMEELEGIYDVVLFCVKSYDLETAAKAMQRHIHPKTSVLSLANGVDNAAVLRDLLDANVLEGVVYILAHIDADGVIRKQGSVFAVVFGGEKSETVAELFEKSNLRYKISSNIKHDIWKKYIFISAFATLTSYYDMSIYEVVHEHPKEARALLEEIALLAKYEGVDIAQEVERSLKTAHSLPPSASTSMHKDFKNKKKTELESLTGYLVRQARKHGVELPYTEKMYKELKKR